MGSEALSPRWDSSRLSTSSFRRQGWPRLSPSYAPPIIDACPTSSRYDETTVNDSDRARSLLLPEQAHGGSQSRSRQGTSANSTPSQPVLVRAYSGNAEDTTSKQSTMSPRRLFSFTNSRSSAPSHPSGPPLPTDKDFSIENILQAIEPNIKGTLDSIAEICGRSKLSLSNEYGSHIAPLGEIRAPPGGLVPVEEASSSEEWRADEGVVIFEDDPNLVDAGGDLHPFSFYRYMESLQQAASAQGRNGVAGLGLSTHPTATRASPHIDLPDPPMTREIASKPKNSGRDLLATNGTSSQDDPRTQDVATSAVVSEVHLDAQAQTGHVGVDVNLLSSDQNGAPGRQTSNSWHPPDVLHSLIGWLSWTARTAGPESRPALESAEGRLRTMLERSAGDGLSGQAAETGAT